MVVQVKGVDITVDDEEAWRFTPAARHQYFVIYKNGIPHVVKDIRADRKKEHDDWVKCKYKRVYLHTELHGTPEGFITYHKDFNTLNFMKSNLAHCKRRHLASVRSEKQAQERGYALVTFHKTKGAWRAHIDLGPCDTRLDAKRAYIKFINNHEEL